RHPRLAERLHDARRGGSLRRRRRDRSRRRPRQGVGVLAALVLVAATAASAAQVRALIEKDEPKAALEQARTLAAESQDPDAIAALGEALYRAGLIDEAGDALSPLAAAEDAPA